MVKKINIIATSLITLFGLIILPIQNVEAARINDFIDMWVDQAIDPDEEEKELLKEIDSALDEYTFDNYYISDDPSSYSGRTVIESIAMGKFETNLVDQDLIKYTVKLLTQQAKRVLQEYPDSELIRVFVMDDENYTMAYVNGTFYNVNGKLVISQNTTSYNMGLDPKQMVGHQIPDDENEKIPSELLGE